MPLLRNLILFVLFALTFAGLESTLEQDARTPTGLSEQVVLLKRDADVTKFSAIYKKLSSTQKRVSASVDSRSYCGTVKQQSESSELTDVGCGSCTAFSAIGAAETAYRVATGRKEIFSEMDIVDCMYHAGGCNGNVREHAIMHVFNNGVATNAAYPYKPRDKGVCDKKPPRLHKYKFVPFTIDQKNPSEWKTFIKNYGGFSMSMYVSGFKFASKTEKDPAKMVVSECEGVTANKGTNHAVQGVGYGSINGIEYILIRNSWGVKAREHDKGYIRVKLGQCNTLLRNFHGFVFDKCADFNKNKSKCTARPDCKYLDLTKKCFSAFLKFENILLDGAAAAAGVIDNIANVFNGVGLNEIPSSHAMRKNGTEFFAYVKFAGKNSNAKKVIELFGKAVSSNAIYAANGRIRDYAKLKSLLGIKKDVITYVACKAHDDAPSKADRNTWYYILKDKPKKKPNGSLSETFYDPRYNRVDYAELHSIIGAASNGYFMWTSETSGGFCRNALTISEKLKYSSELICYARAGKKRVKNDAMAIIKALPKGVYDTESKKIMSYTELKKKLGAPSTTKTFKCSTDLWYYQEGKKYWNCKSNTFDALPANCKEFVAKDTKV